MVEGARLRGRDGLAGGSQDQDRKEEHGGGGGGGVIAGTDTDELIKVGLGEEKSQVYRRHT